MVATLPYSQKECKKPIFRGRVLISGSGLIKKLKSWRKKWLWGGSWRVTIPCVSWICLLDAWNKSKLFSQTMVWWWFATIFLSENNQGNPSALYKVLHGSAIKTPPKNMIKALWSRIKGSLVGFITPDLNNPSWWFVFLLPFWVSYLLRMLMGCGSGVPSGIRLPGGCWVTWRW